MSNKANKLHPERFKLQFISNQWSSHSISEQAKDVCEGGGKWIQLRLKDSYNEAFCRQAKEIKALCKKFNATFIINDQVEVAIKTDADGVHLGKEDMDPRKAREILGENKIIGATANTLEDVIQLHGKGVDYIGLGPFRDTLTKKKLSPLLGFEGYQIILNQLEAKNIKTPVVAIGGIRLTDIPGLFQTGISGVAISSLISHSSNPQKMTSTLISHIQKSKSHVNNSR